MSRAIFRPLVQGFDQRFGEGHAGHELRGARCDRAGSVWLQEGRGYAGNTRHVKKQYLYAMKLVQRVWPPCLAP